MAQPNISQQEWLKVLGKGMITLPKKWREELGIASGDVVKAKKDGNRIIIEGKNLNAPYRLYTDAEIEVFLDGDRLPRSLSKRVDEDLKKRSSRT